MPNMQELLKQIQRELACPICGRKYELNQIKIRSVFEQVLIVQTTCSDGHLTLLMTIIKEQDKVKKELKPGLTTNEVLDLSNSLNSFKGDFEKEWKQ